MTVKGLKVVYKAVLPLVYMESTNKNARLPRYFHCIRFSATWKILPLGDGPTNVKLVYQKWSLYGPRATCCSPDCFLFLYYTEDESIEIKNKREQQLKSFKAESSRCAPYKLDIPPYVLQPKAPGSLHPTTCQRQCPVIGTVWTDVGMYVLMCCPTEDDVISSFCNKMPREIYRLLQNIFSNMQKSHW